MLCCRRAPSPLFFAGTRETGRPRRCSQHCPGHSICSAHLGHERRCCKMLNFPRR